MRRKIDNQSVFFVILIAFFTLLSYGFDQFVIRSEDKLRTQDIKFQNLSSEKRSLETLSDQILTHTTDIYIQATEKLQNRNTWLKQYMLLTHDELKEINFEKNFSENYDLIEWSKSQLVEQHRDYLKFSGISEINLSKIFRYYERVLPDFQNWYSNDYHYAKEYTNWEQIFNNNISKFNTKDYKFYASSLEADKFDDFKIQNWIDLNNFGKLIVKNILNLQYKISEDTIKIEKKLYKIEDDLNKILNEIKKASALKNYYILSSIFSQILSLLILLILFRHLLLNIKKRK